MFEMLKPLISSNTHNLWAAPNHSILVGILGKCLPSWPAFFALVHSL